MKKPDIRGFKKILLVELNLIAGISVHLISKSGLTTVVSGFIIALTAIGVGGNVLAKFSKK